MVEVAVESYLKKSLKLGLRRKILFSQLIQTLILTLTINCIANIFVNDQEDETVLKYSAFAAQLNEIRNFNSNLDIHSKNFNQHDQEEKTADLTKLINETLAINNKSLPNGAKSTIFKDDWTFDRVEYDLMEFLQDLSARYKLNNASSPEQENLYGEYLKEANLEAKRIQSTKELSSNETSVPEINVNKLSTATTTITTTTSSSVAESTTTSKPSLVSPENVTSKQDSFEPTSSSTTTTTTPKPPSSSSSQSSVESTNIRIASSSLRPTLSPQLSTSLASGEPEIAESSWQYGIFDRFTRPKSTTTTREPTLDSNANLNVRNFNSDECGLRTYDIGSEVLHSQANDFEAEASKELNQRRQRPILNTLTSSHKKYQFETVAESIANDDNNNNNAQGDANDRVYDAYESYDKGQDPSSSNNSEEAQQPPSSDQNADNEFNLASRRHWLQQQLGNTLQLLGFNTSSQSVAEYLNQTSGNSLNMRENMMKKSGKLGKASILNALHHSASENLNPRQDELKLEARVIGGNDARLGDSPWSVSLQALVSKPGTVGVEYRHYCGGTIISEHYVLTAAHCLDFMVGRESRLFVVMGDLNWRMSAASLYGRRFGIEKLIIHSGYKSTAFGHDIGLIKTKESMKPLKVNGRYIINSVCLPEKNVEHSGEAELVGWGLFSNRNEMADTLQVADVPILPRPLCVDLYKRRTGLIQWLIGIELITDKQVCAGTFGRGICQGDSGSALVVNEKYIKRNTKQIAKYLRSSSSQTEQTKATIIGVVAFGGIRRCSYQSLPGVYMQTSKYLDWILPRIAN